MIPLLDAAKNLLRQHTGPLTRDLLLSPAGFGLGQVPDQRQPDATATTVCGYCSTGCGLNVHLRQGEAVNLSPRTQYPVNLGMACPKGWEALTVLQSDDRATEPRLKGANGRLEAVTWETALTTFVERFKAIQTEYGPDSLAFLSTGQIPTEEMALLGAVAKFGMGIVHGDGNTRQCMATAVVAYKQSFGFDAPPYTYQDFEESDVIVLVGSNLCIAHPILWERVLRNPRRPEIVVIDPRRTETAMQATRHLAIAPKSDLELFYGLAHILIECDWIKPEYIAAHTSGFEEFKTFVKAFTPEKVSATTGIEVNTLFDIARLIHERERVSFWWTMGVNQSHQGVRTAQAIINLALMTGQIGRPGTGANSITGQANAMGSRLFSNTTSLLGGRDFTKAIDREAVADILDMDVARIPDRQSWAYPEIVEGILRGKIRGLWIIATNPMHSWINQGQFADVLDRLDFLVVQDMYHSTETARRADLLLPAAGWGEKDGTFINSERRIGRTRRVARPPGHALPDFAIFKLVAEAWGCGDLFRDWNSPEAVFQILKQLSAGTPCDFTGIADYAMLDACGGVQWPHPASADVLAPEVPETERRLFADGKFCHPDGKAKFLFEASRPMPEAPSPEYPLILLTGRGSASQWHTQTRTAKSAVLRKLYPKNIYVEIHPADARSLGIAANDRVIVKSQRGEISAQAVLTPTVAAGQVFIPMHYATANVLTDAVFDPYSRQPSYKACAVRVRPA